MSARCGQIFLCVALIITTHSSGGDVISRTMIFKEEEKEMKSLCSSLHHYFPHLLFLSTSKKGDMCMWTTGGGKKNCTVAFGKASSIQQTAPTHYQVSTIPSSSSLSLSPSGNRLKERADHNHKCNILHGEVCHDGGRQWRHMFASYVCIVYPVQRYGTCGVSLYKIYIGPSFSPDEFG